MIYSKWNGSGKYDYFDAPGDHPIGTDFPSSNHEDLHPIGTPINLVGRDIPSGARRVGQGDQPKGLMAKAKKARSSLSGMPSGDNTFAFFAVASVIMGLVVVGLSLPEVKK